MKPSQGAKIPRKEGRRHGLTKEVFEAQCGWNRVRLERGTKVTCPTALWATSGIMDFTPEAMGSHRMALSSEDPLSRLKILRIRDGVLFLSVSLYSYPSVWHIILRTIC